MFLRGDIVSIVGMHNTGKTTFAKYLASTLDKNFIYIDFIHTSYDELEDLYNKNKSINCVIVFDNYVMMTNNMRRINLFKHNKKFTLIFVLNYIERPIIYMSDSIYFAKNTEKTNIDTYYDLISKYYHNKNLFIENMNKLRNYGFICVDKDNKNKFNEELIKIDF